MSRKWRYRTPIDILLSFRITALLVGLAHNFVMAQKLGIKYAEVSLTYMSCWVHWNYALYFAMTLIATKVYKAVLAKYFHVLLSYAWATSIYFWAIMIPQYREQYYHYYNDNPYFFQSMHVNPVVFLTFDFLMNRLRMDNESWKWLLGFGIIYGIINFITVKIKQAPLYDFLDWQDHWSLIWYGCVLGVTMAVWYLILQLQRLKFKPTEMH